MNLGWQLRAGITTQGCIPGAPPQSGWSVRAPSAPVISWSRAIELDQRARCSDRCLFTCSRTGLAGALSPLTALERKSLNLSGFKFFFSPYTVE